MTLNLYGIPTCGTCKKAMQWLQHQQIAYEFINLKTSSPSAAEIETWVDSLGAKALRNTSGQSYRALGAEKQDWTDQQWISAFTEDPMLIKRPVWVQDGQPVMVGFRLTTSEMREKLGL